MYPMTNSMRIPIFDGHNDTLGQVSAPPYGKGRSFFVRSDEGHIDLPRAQEGGLGGGLFAVYVSAESAEEEPSDDPTPGSIPEAFRGIPDRFPEARHFLEGAWAEISLLFQLEAESQGQLKVVRTADELRACLGNGVLAAVLHLEGAEPIDPDLEALPLYYDAGLRSVGLVWSRPNAFGHGVPFDFPSSPDTGPGLTEPGKALVRACNRMGVMVDLSHLNEKGFWDVAGLSDAPLVATHSGVHALCPSSRNLTDRQLEAIAESGGLVGVNFHVGFVRADGQDDPATPIDDIVRHVDYIARRIGVEHVAFGSDFDGAMMPLELKDASGLPKLLAALRARGYGDGELKQIAHQNWVRVLAQTWK
jgi:membrane dipeptidase